MNLIQLIGVGPGRENLLTNEARIAIDQADVVFAAARHAPLAKRTSPMEPIATVCDRIRAERDAGYRVAVLVSGDPCLYSMLGMLQNALGHDAVEVLPGVGALQQFCARIGKLWQDAAIISGHGRALSISALGYTVRTHRKTILFCDSTRDARWAATALLLEGLDHVQMCVGERLSYSDERIVWGLPAQLQSMQADPLCLIWFENNAPILGFPCFGIPDERFVRGKIPMTKSPIRIQVLSSLDIRPDSVVWDVGAGTGSVSIECALHCPMGEVYAIERKAEGVELINKNAAQMHINNLKVIAGKAPDALEQLPTPTHVFIGGTSGMLREIIQKIRDRHTLVRVVATAVTLESLAELSEVFSDKAFTDKSIVQLAVSRAEPLGKYQLMTALNPVTIFSANLEGNI